MLDELFRLLWATDDSGGGGDEGGDNGSGTDDDGDTGDDNDTGGDGDTKKDDASPGDSGDTEDADKLSDDPKELQKQIKAMGTSLKKANKEARDRRLKLKKYEDDESKRKKEKMDELERAQTEAKEETEKRSAMEVSLRNMTVKSAVETIATEMSFHNAGTAYRLADLEVVRELVKNDEGLAERLEVSADTNKAIKASLKILAKENEYLIKKTKKTTNLDGRERSKDKDVEESAIARRFGINQQ